MKSGACMIPAVRPRCKVCGFRIRGKNHENGEHHQQAVKRLKELWGDKWERHVA
jgi:hypothetical protein